jgi:PAT family beta-lactamase induction signal transducer AmpG
MTMSFHRQETPDSRRIHPWVFLVLEIPFGVVSGYVMVTLAYQLKQEGASVGQIAALAGLAILPNTWKFFWAPIVDLTLNQKKWYLLTGFLSAIGIAAMGFLPATRHGLTALSAVVFTTSMATTFLGMSVESLLAYSTPAELKGRASGWFNAGNLGGNGLGGGLGLLLIQHLPEPWMASCIVGGLCLLCSAALVAVPTPARMLNATGIFSSLAATAKDLWQILRKRAGAVALIVAMLPIGTAAINFAPIAGEWRASANTVALVTGVLSGIICAAGCLMGGWVCDRMDRKTAYVWFGVFQAAAGIAMALLPRTQSMYILWTSAYGFTSGLTYAAFSAFVLETIGKGAAATKYNAFASLSNVPIYYMTNLDGWAHDRWNSKGMFFFESGIAMASAVVFVILVGIFGRENINPGTVA